MTNNPYDAILITKAEAQMLLVLLDSHSHPISGEKLNQMWRDRNSMSAIKKLRQVTGIKFKRPIFRE